MVNTRFQTSRYILVDMSGMDRSSDSESDSSVPEILTRDQIIEFKNGDLLNYQNDNDRHTVDLRFSEMNKQISDLSNLVLALTEKIASSNREGNELNTVSIGRETHSDMPTGVGSSNAQTNPSRSSTSHYPQPPAHQIDDIVTEIHHLRDTLTDSVHHPKILQTQLPLFLGNREKYNEFEPLLLNHLRPHQHELSEEQKLTYFQCLLCEDAI